MREDSTLYWLFPDHLGSTNITANSSWTKVAEMRYKPWGETRYTSGTTPTDFHYTGHREETDLGFYYHKARWCACPDRRPQAAYEGSLPWAVDPTPKIDPDVKLGSG